MATNSTKPAWLQSLEKKDKTTGTVVSRAAERNAASASNSSGSGSASNKSGGGNYTIGSDRGKSIANNMSIGTSWTNDVDGSVWTKNNDGSISVNHNGVVTSNAYQPHKYTIGSERGKNIANNMTVGTSWTNDVDGSVWTKNYDGSVSVNYNGVTTPNAYQTTNSSNQNAAQQNFMNWLNDFMQKNAKPTEPTRDPRIDEKLNEILNRDGFSYDASDDPLYQQYAQMYQREGDRAMRETLAEAAASAGGMNTYAITAAQQANNYYNSQLNDRIPELYQLAYDMYLAEKESEVQDLGLLQAMDETQYNRYLNTLNDWYNDKNFAYGAYQDAVAQGNWQTNRDDNLRLNEQQFAYDDYRWNKEWDYNEQWDNKKWSKQEQEDAKAEVKYWMEKGYMPDDELIEKSGMDKSLVEKRVAEIQAQMAGTGYSGGGGSRSGGSGYTGGNGGSEYTNYTNNNSNNSGTVSVEDAAEIVYARDGSSAYRNYLQEAFASGAINQKEMMDLIMKH